MKCKCYLWNSIASSALSYTLEQPNIQFLLVTRKKPQQHQQKLLLNFGEYAWCTHFGYGRQRRKLINIFLDARVLCFCFGRKFFCFYSSISLVGFFQFSSHQFFSHTLIKSSSLRFACSFFCIPSSRKCSV